MAITLLAATTNATASTSFKVGKGEGSHSPSRPVTLVATGLAGAERGDVQISHDGGTTWNDLYESGSQVQLSPTNTAEVINAPGWYRVNKDATAGASGIFLLTPLSP